MHTMNVSIKMNSVILGCGLSFALGLGNPVCAQTAVSTVVSPTRRPSPTQQHRFLRQPDGLEKLSLALDSDVEVALIEEVWGELDLESLTKASDLVIQGSVQKLATKISSDGDSVETSFVLLPSIALKGNDLSPKTFTVSGGTVRLSNGHLATVTSKEETVLHDPGQVIIFLKKSATGYKLSAESPSIVLISSAGNADDKSVAVAGRQSKLVKQVSGQPLSMTQAMILAAANVSER